MIQHTWVKHRKLIVLCLFLLFFSSLWYFYSVPSFQNKCNYLLSAPQSPRMTPWPRTPTVSQASVQFVSAKRPLTGSRNPTCAFLELGMTNPAQATARLQFRVITSMEWGDGEITWHLPFDVSPQDSTIRWKRIERDVARGVALYTQQVPIEPFYDETYVLDVRVPEGKVVSLGASVVPFFQGSPTGARDGHTIHVQTTTRSIRIVEPTPWSPPPAINLTTDLALHHSEGGVNALQTIVLTVKADEALEGTITWNLSSALELVGGSLVQPVSLQSGETRQYSIVIRPLQEASTGLSVLLRTSSERPLSNPETFMNIIVTANEARVARPPR